MFIVRMKDGNQSFINEKMVQRIDYAKEIDTVAVVLDETKNEVTFLRNVESVSYYSPAEVYLCILRHDDGTFKSIVGCFYSKEAAERYASGSPRITIQKQYVK